MSSFDRENLILILRSLLKIDDVKVIKFALESLVDKLEEAEGIVSQNDDTFNDFEGDK